jgi:hypothetical protein
MATPKRIVPEAAMNFQSLAANANVSASQTATMVKAKFGFQLSRRQVAKCQSVSNLADNLLTEEEKIALGAGASDTDRVLAYLRNKNASYIALFHRKGPATESEISGSRNRKLVENPKGPTAEDFLWVESIDNSGTVLGSMVGCGDATIDDMLEYARESRTSVHAEDMQDVLISLAWVLPSSKRCFLAFPEVCFVDGTHKTNKEDRPLITMGIKDMDGKMQIVLRCWAPNERAWMFRWLFKSAVPTIFGKEGCERIRLVITDGDSQEYSQLDAAIAAVFINARRRRCGWHIVTKGWDKHVRSSIGKCPAAQKVSLIVKSWLYSLMKSVETMDEYNM